MTIDLSIKNIRVSREEDILIDIVISLSNRKVPPIVFNDVETTSLYSALSNILHSFIYSKVYENQTLISVPKCVIKTEQAAGLNMLRIEFEIDKGDSKYFIIHTSVLSDWIGTVYKNIIISLINLEQFHLCEAWASSTRMLPPDSPFKIGDHVLTVKGGNVKTERSGYIYSRTYHDKKQKHLYYLLIDGKPYKKQYYDDELKLN